jgi:pimeloyl-ACP methyl ester carboxylesterase
MDLIEVEGLRIAYERVGVGPPLVLAHGFVGDGRSTWCSQLDDLSDEFTVVAWDAPGAGRSAEPPEWFRMSDYADCFVAFVRALSLERPHLIGLSFGGALVLEVFRKDPTIPRTLVLASAYAGWAGSMSPEAVEERLQRCLRLADLPPEQFADAMMPSMFSPSAPAEAVARFVASVRGFNRAGFLAMTWSSAEADLRDVLASVNVPTLLLYGDEDVRAPRDIAEALHSAIPASTLIVMSGVGHVSPVEAPDLFNRHVRNFLDNVEANRGRGSASTRGTSVTS